MESSSTSATSNKRRRIILSYVSPPRPDDLPAIFESLNDDTLTTVLEFVGGKSYKSFGGTNKRCREIYLTTKGMTKETFMYGYGPLLVILDIIERTNELQKAVGEGVFWDYEFFESVGKGVVFYGRRDVMDWAVQEQNKYLLYGICRVAAGEGRFDLLEEVWNHIENDDEKEWVFRGGECSAAIHGKQEVLKWLETKGLSIDISDCGNKAAFHGQLHLLKWLREEKGLDLDRYLYFEAIGGGHLHVMKWLREQGCPWNKRTFYDAAKKGNLDILQWLHGEGCLWPRGVDFEYSVRGLKPEVIDWLRANGHGDRRQN